MPRCSVELPIFGLICLLFISSPSAFAQANEINVAENSAGRLPKDTSGRELNLNFETGDLRDWTATGTAFRGQPDKNGIDPRRPLAGMKKSLHTGQFWIGGYEIVGDEPHGTLTSVPFLVDAPWCSFLIGGGSSRQTRVELVREDTQEVIATRLGNDEEEMHPVVLDLENVRGKKLLIRLVDEASGGWGHLNFDDFRFHDVKPVFKNLPVPLARVFDTKIYPYQNLSGEEAARVMQVPPGFKVQCAAHEPDVRQPIAMAIDDRGRIWVAEAYSYPLRAAPGTGKDRILIFEDTDHDGTLDRRTVFIEELNLVSGFELGFGGVYVGAAPYLLFIPDRNQNDIPDAQESGFTPAPLPEGLKFPQDVPQGAEVLLDGWGWEDTHETLNAFNWGPDGWLYGCHGVFTHSQVGRPGTPPDQRVRLNAGIWRYHPVRHVFELFSEGTSNPWGVDFNQYGDAFCTACVIPHLYYMIPHGRYQRQAGNHFNPYTYRDIQTIARHRHYVGNQWNQADRRTSDQQGGGHAHAGAMVYLGGAWPEEYTGKLFMHNIHGNRVNVDQLIPEGSGYAGDRSPDFLLTGDAWSQMINLQYGPDGQVWMIDWYDQEQCHRREADVIDRGNGRIYRVSYGDVAPVTVDLQKLDNSALVNNALTAKNEWYARHARRILHERAAEGKVSLTDLVGIVDTGNTLQMLRLLWLRNLLGGFTSFPEGTFDPVLGHPDPHVRAWMIRLLVQNAPEGKLSAALLQTFVRLATEDPSPIVRLELASACCSLPLADRWVLVEKLISHRQDASDHNLPLLYWYAMEPLADSAPQRALALGISAGETIPLLRELMIRRLGSGTPEQSLKLLMEGLSQAGSDEVRLTFLKGIRGALTGTRTVHPPEEWANVYRLLTNPELQSRSFDVYLYALGLGARFGNEQASADLNRIVLDEAGPQQERRVAFSFMVEDRNPQLSDSIGLLLQGTSLRSEAIRAVATLNAPPLAQTLIDVYKSLNPVEQGEARNTLASRPSYAQALLHAVVANRVPRSDLSADLVRQLRNLNQPEINALVEKTWGSVRESSVDAQAEIARLTALVTDPQLPAADPQQGRAIFARTCQQCHTLFGTGGKIGPDITGSNRANLNYLLSNVVDPSAVMAKEYRPTVLAMSDGRVLTGIPREETTQSIVLQTVNELVAAPKEEIDDRKESEKSMMPDGLLHNLSPHDIRSLVAYLGSPQQVPMRADVDTVGRFFNGTDLTGWQAVQPDEAAAWTVENGELIGRTSASLSQSTLISALSVCNFILTGEMKWSSPVPGHAAIRLRTGQTADGLLTGDRFSFGTLPESPLSSNQGQDLPFDSLSGSSNSPPLKLIPGEWVSFRIICVGSRTLITLNGQQVVDQISLDVPLGGPLAWQIRSSQPSEFRLRNLQLKLADPLPPYAQGGSSPQAWPVSTALAAGQKITWKKTVLSRQFHSEGCCIADFDNDGDLDLAAGAFWYEHPDTPDGQWIPHAILEQPAEFKLDGYSDSFMNFADDLNGDGWVDQIVVSYPGRQTRWFANPGRSAERQESWKQREIIPITNNESPAYLDLNNDGQRELISGVGNKIIASSSPSTFPQAPWIMTSLSESGAPGTDMYSHGLGAGDLNGDGRPDVFITAGWWEQPEQRTGQTWVFHPASLGQPCAQMYAFDIDHDGDADVISSSAHGFGIWWHEQIRPANADSAQESTWKEHLIDSSLSQTHAALLADLNGDGLPDFVTGRRHWAHNGHDPGEDQPAFLAWFELQNSPNGPHWVKHLIDEDSGVGTQFEIADVNQDGLLDIVTSSKKGTFLFEQQRE